MALSKLIGKGIGGASRFGSAANKGKNRMVASLDDDVVEETRRDVAAVRRAMRIAEGDEPTTRGAARASVSEAGSRAMTRTASRAGAVGAAGAAGAALGTAANERANETRRRLMEEEDKTPKRVAVASRTMDDDEMDTIKKRFDEEKSKRVENKEDKKEMSFKEAFASARKDDKSTFTWQGKRYTTELAKEGPKASVREGRNENIDDDTRKRAEMNKGGAVRKYSMGGASIPVVYAGAKKLTKSMPNPALAAKRLNKPKPVAVKSKMAKGGVVKGKKK